LKIKQKRRKNNQTRLLLAMVVLVSFLSLGLETSLAAPPLPDDIKIVPPDSSVPPEIAAFFGKSGKWAGTYVVPMISSFPSAKAEVILILEEIKEKEAKIIFAIEGSTGLGTGHHRATAKIFTRRRKVLLSFTLSSSRDRLAEAEFWVGKDGIMYGERTAQTSYGIVTSTFTLKPLD
jgi:hypothetical protein